MKKDPDVFLKHILESVGDIENHVQGVSRFKFFRDVKSQDAVVRKLEIIGEAVKNLPPNFKKVHPTIPWHKVADIRNVLIHEYFGVDLNIVWNTVKKDLPELKRKISSLLKHPLQHRTLRSQRQRPNRL